MQKISQKGILAQHLQKSGHWVFWLFDLKFYFRAIAHSITSNPLFYCNLGFGPMNGQFSFIPPIFTLVASLVLIYLAKQ